MSSYHSYFTYQNFSSLEKGLIISAFDADSGETSAFLGMDSMYSENPSTGVRYDYGAKYKEVATIKITLITFDGSDFTEDRFRDTVRWLSGAPKSSWLDLYKNNILSYSFLCKCVDIQHYKMDARTIGITATFESISPWAYSPIQTVTQQIINMGEAKDGYPLAVNNLSDEMYSYLYPNIEFSNSIVYEFVADGISDKFLLERAIPHITLVTIDNETTDYSYRDGAIFFDTPPKEDAVIRVFGNFGTTSLSIYNKTTKETTTVSNILEDEVITMNSNQIIYSNNESRIFGEDFNFVWTRLAYGINILCASGQGTLKITYRYPIKIGDCVMDLNTDISAPACELANQEIATDEQVKAMFEDVYKTRFGGIV